MLQHEAELFIVRGLTAWLVRTTAARQAQSPGDAKHLLGVHGLQHIGTKLRVPSLLFLDREHQQLVN